MTNLSEEILVESPVRGVGVIRLNRPERLNALTPSMLYEGLPSAVEELDSDPSIHVIVVTGAGRGFCAGADLNAGAFEVEDLVAHVKRSHAGPWRLYNSNKPSIAAVNGPAAGAGMGLAMACDIRIGSMTSKFVTAFISMAMVPDFGLTWSLSNAVGKDRALRMLLENATLSATEALQTGVITSIAVDAYTDALTLAKQIAETPYAAALIKSGLRRAVLEGMNATLFDIEPEAQRAAMSSAEFRKHFEDYRGRITGQ